jgi:hypothetical protein
MNRDYRIFTLFESEVHPYGLRGAGHRWLHRQRQHLHQMACDVRLVSVLAFESDGPEEEWFQPLERLATIDALLRFMKSNPAYIPEQAEVMADLAEIRSEVETARHAGVRFRLCW